MEKDRYENKKHQVPKTNDQIITKISITETLNPSPHPSPLGGEGKGEGRFG
jgi:hypothetical protein